MPARNKIRVKSNNNQAHTVIKKSTTLLISLLAIFEFREEGTARESEREGQHIEGRARVTKTKEEKSANAK